MIILYDKITLIPIQIIDGCDDNNDKLETDKYKGVIVESIPDNLQNKKYDISTGAFVDK